MSTNKETNFAELIGDLNAGVFAQQIERALSDTALGVVTHKLNYVKPTLRGRATEEYATETPMHVGPRGALSLFPHEQASLFGGSDAAKERA